MTSPDPPVRSWSPQQVRLAATIFLGASLLFVLQPLQGKNILPVFGGSHGVWTTCLLFFQALLTLGYAYAHFLTRLRLPTQRRVHISLLIASLLALPLLPGLSHEPVAGSPALSILWHLTRTVGLPYTLLAATAPLVQHWYSVDHPTSPYRLYALSNVGSLLALLAYPFAIEPLLSLRLQIFLWCFLYGAFTLVCGHTLFCVAKGRGTEPSPQRTPGKRTTPKVSREIRVLWITLPAFASLMLLATTNQVCQDVASVPFLWVFPLALYILSYILCFDHSRWYDRRIWGTALVVGLGASLYLLEQGAFVRVWVQLGIFLSTLFVCCMVLHGELVRIKPASEHLTAFYLSLAIGGALGGVAVSLVAPVVFRGFWEFPIGLFGSAVLFFLCLARSSELKPLIRKPAWTLTLVALLGGGWFVSSISSRDAENTLATRRNFYGVLRVFDKGPDSPARELWHGRIRHGSQFMDPRRNMQPTTYFTMRSGIGLAARRHPRRRVGQPMRIGVIGLGAGTTAAHGRAGDVIRFYEINPAVVRITREYFSYLQDGDATSEVILGDARLSMELERARNQLQAFDILVLDAFSADAVPVHLLTREAFQLYWAHLATGGILAVNVTNYHLDLKPVVQTLATNIRKSSLLVTTNEDQRRAIDFSEWMLVTSNQKFLRDPQVTRRASSTLPVPRNTRIWTDDYTNLIATLKN